ncbi:MAG: DUF3754 domain-containing protein, partial [Planctomycetota bacterium]
KLNQCLEFILERGNFLYLREEDLYDLLHHHSPLGIHIEVDPDQYRHFGVYVRGEYTCLEKRKKASFLSFHKPYEEVPYFQRVLVMLQGVELEFPPFWKRWLHSMIEFFQDRPRTLLPMRAELEKEITIKLFKDIRKDSLQILFPHIRMSMTTLDRLRIGIPCVGGITVVIFKFLVAAALSPITLIILLGSFIGYIINSILGYQTTKKLYLKKLMENLYHNNLDNNEGALAHIVDLAEEEELKEAILALHFLWTKEKWSHGEVTLNQLTSQVESFLEERFGLPLSFEGDDAVYKLGYRKRGQSFEAGKEAIEKVFHPLGLLLEPKKISFFLEDDLPKGSQTFSLPSLQEALPLKGTFVMEEEKEKEFRIPFRRFPWSFAIENASFGGGARISHPKGASVLWRREMPWALTLSNSLKQNQSFLEVEDIPSRLPLRGVGEIQEGSQKWTFRFRRKKESKRLYFESTFEKGFVPRKEAPLWLKLVPPRWKVEKEITHESPHLFTSLARILPPSGILKFLTPAQTFFCPYQAEREKELLHVVLPNDSVIPKGSEVSLSSVSSFLSEPIKKGNHSLVLEDLCHFQGQGRLRLEPGTPKEEVLEFRREIFHLELLETPKFRHPLGSTVVLYSQQGTTKVKLVQSLDKESRNLLVHGHHPFPAEGKAVFEPFGENREEISFQSHSKILYLPQGPKYFHG